MSKKSGVNPYHTKNVLTEISLTELVGRSLTVSMCRQKSVQLPQLFTCSPPSLTLTSDN